MSGNNKSVSVGKREKECQVIMQVNDKVYKEG